MSEYIIDIPEHIYRQCKDDIPTIDLLELLMDAVKNSTPLPKHGRLGDLDALREEVSSWGMNDYEPSDFTDEIDRTDTIIEADKEQIDNGNDD